MEIKILGEKYKLSKIFRLCILALGFILVGCNSQPNDSSSANSNKNVIVNGDQPLTINAMGSIPLPNMVGSSFATNTWIHNNTNEVISNVSYTAAYSSGGDITDGVIDHNNVSTIEPNSEEMVMFHTPENCSDGNYVVITAHYVFNHKNLSSSSMFSCETLAEKVERGVVFGGVSPRVYGSSYLHYVTIYATGSGNDIIYNDLSLKLPPWIEVTNNNFTQAAGFASNEIQAMELSIPGNARGGTIELNSKLGANSYTSQSTIGSLPESTPQLLFSNNMIFNSSSTNTVTMFLVNPGIEPVNVTGVNSSNTNLTAGANTCTDIQPGASCSIVFNLSSNQNENTNSSSLITVSYVGITSGITGTSNGTIQWFNQIGFQPLQVSANSIIAYVTRSYTQSITITNTGSSPIQLPSSFPAVNDLSRGSGSFNLGYTTGVNACSQSQSLNPQQSCTLLLSLTFNSVSNGNILINIPFSLGNTQYSRAYLIPYQVSPWEPNIIATPESINVYANYSGIATQQLVMMNTGPVATNQIRLRFPSRNSDKNTYINGCESPNVSRSLAATKVLWVSQPIPAFGSCTLTITTDVKDALGGGSGVWSTGSNLYFEYTGGAVIDTSAPKAMTISGTWINNPQSLLVSRSATGSISGNGSSSSTPFVLSGSKSGRDNSSVVISVTNLNASQYRISSVTNSNSSRWLLDNSVGAKPCVIGATLNQGESCTMTFKISPTAVIGTASIDSSNISFPSIGFTVLTGGGGNFTFGASSTFVNISQAVITTQLQHVSSSLTKEVSLNQIVTNESGYNTFQSIFSSIGGYESGLFTTKTVPSNCSVSGLTGTNFIQSCNFGGSGKSSESAMVTYSINQSLFNKRYIISSSYSSVNNGQLVTSLSPIKVILEPLPKSIYVTDFGPVSTTNKVFWKYDVYGGADIRFDKLIYFPEANSTYSPLGTVVSGNYLYLMLGTTWRFNASESDSGGRIIVCSINPMTADPDCSSNTEVPMPSSITSWHPIDIYTLNGYAYIVDDKNQKTWIYSISGVDGSLTYTNQWVDVPAALTANLYTPVSVTGVGNYVYVGYNRVSGLVVNNTSNNGAIYRYSLNAANGALIDPLRPANESSVFNVFSIRTYHGIMFVQSSGRRLDSTVNSSGVIDASDNFLFSTYLIYQINNSLAASAMNQKSGTSFTGGYPILFGADGILLGNSNNYGGCSIMYGMFNSWMDYSGSGSAATINYPRPSLPIYSGAQTKAFGPISAYPALQY